MCHMTSKYERELRHVLAGIPAGVEAVIKSCSIEEKERMRLVINRPFLVVRAAGSGIEGSGDLLALRGDISFPIEVKTTKERRSISVVERSTSTTLLHTKENAAGLMLFTLID